MSMSAMVVFPFMLLQWKCSLHLKKGNAPCDSISWADNKPGDCGLMSCRFMSPPDLPVPEYLSSGWIWSNALGLLGFCLVYPDIKALMFYFFQSIQPSLSADKQMTQEKTKILASQIIHGWYIANMPVPCNAEVGRQMGQPLKIPGLKMFFSYFHVYRAFFFIVMFLPY